MIQFTFLFNIRSIAGLVFIITLAFGVAGYAVDSFLLEKLWLKAN